MRRREFLITLSSVALAGPSVAQPQTSTKTVGILDPGAAHVFEAFEQGMRSLGYIEGRTINYVKRFAGGRPDLVPQLAVEIVSSKVDIIVTAAPLPVRSVMRATSTIPIVFLALGDAVATGVVTNFAKPGGNVTGLSFLNSELSEKRLELLHDGFPTLKRITVFHDPNNTAQYIEATKKSGERLNLQLEFSPLSGVEAFEPAFVKAASSGAEAVNVLASVFFLANRARLIALAEKFRLPAIYETGDYVRSGGLMAYGPDLRDMARRSATYVHKILNGEKPGDLPVEQPTKFEFLINLKSAKLIGLTIPEAFLLRADEVIE